MSDITSPMPAPEENDESYFVSMTDLMVGMLFIFVIMLMSFVLNLRQAQEASVETVESLSSSRATRGHILERLQKYLRERGIAVEIELEHGVLRLPEEILFASGSAEVSAQGATNLAFLAEALTAILPCFATPPNLVPPAGCNSGFGGRLEAILIEGHTDGDPVHGGAWYRSNLGLSAFRSISTYDRLVTAQPKLNEFLNDRGEVLFGVSGYGDQRRRQVVERSDADKRLNRRIDLRFLMAIPRPEALIALEKQAYDRIGRTSARRP